MNKSSLFNSKSICIFTDSSFRQNENCSKGQAIGTAAPAVCIYQNDTCVEQTFQIINNVTSQQGELYALLLGVIASYKYKLFPNIRIFSDNQTSVFALRRRIFKWMAETAKGNPMLGDSGKIKNQSLIMAIVYTILANNTALELFHVKGHVKINSPNSMEEATRMFKTSNPFVGKKISADLIRQIAIGNDTVDRYSTLMLENYLEKSKYDIPKAVNSISFSYAPFDVQRYASLILNREYES